MLVVTFIMYCVVSCALGQAVTLNLNANSTVYDDIKSIVHDPTLQRVTIVLHYHRRCLNPTFRLRLSGPSLYVLDLVKHEHDDLHLNFSGYAKQFLSQRKNVYFFNYPTLVETGEYFLEAIILICGSVDGNNFAGVCLENVQNARNVVNLPYSFRHASYAKRGGQAASRPRWVHQNISNSAYRYTMLLTRYQHHDCPEALFCAHTDTSQHAQYRWVHAPDWKVPYEQVRISIRLVIIIFLQFVLDFHALYLVDKDEPAE